MKRRVLGRSGLTVSELCFGTLPMGPLQANLPVEEGARVLAHALELGVNFIDSAAMYGTYPYIRRALELVPAEVVITSKSVAPDFDGMKVHIEEARDALGRYPDIFLLHAARLERPFDERPGAIECLKEYRAQGKLKAIGLSTHSVQAVRAAASQEFVDIVHPLINRKGMGLLSGTVDEMSEAINVVHRNGVGVYAMKALAGGNGLDEMDLNFGFVRGLEGMDAVAVGMIHETEVDIDAALFSGAPFTEDMHRKALDARARKHLSVQVFCRGCGECVRFCPNKAMTLQNGRAAADLDKCLLCGYCSTICPMFAIRVV